MQKTITTFLMWLLIAMIGLPACVLSLPANKAQAATETKEMVAPVTQLSTTPKRPNINGWFNQVTVIKLKSSDGGKVFFQWNSTNGAWQEYDQAIQAWRGSNTLYYYAQNSSAQEMIQSRLIQVAYGHPQEPVVQIVSADNQAYLSWEQRADINMLRISKNGDPLVQVPAENSFYLDNDVKNNNIYVYKLKAIDRAGLKSKAVKIPVQITDLNGVKRIQPTIGTGATTKVAEIPASQAETIKPAPIEEPGESPSEPPVKNWNRLFIALSILIIAAGAAIAGYYGYEWWMSRQDSSSEPRDKKSDRW